MSQGDVVYNLRKEAIQRLLKDLRTTSIITAEEAKMLAIGYALIDLSKRGNGKEKKLSFAEMVLKPLLDNFLYLKISVDGAGRKDLKEIVNPQRIYPGYGAQAWDLINQLMVQGEKKEEKKRRWF
jgi:hypothetical protein